jgi:hypothetical protein
VIIHPDAVHLAVTYLRGVLAPGVTVAAAVPNPRPAGALVVVNRAGGVETTRGVFDRPRLEVNVWHATAFDALAVAAVVRGHLLNAHRTVPGVVNAGTTAGLTTVADPSGAARALFTVEWTVRGAQQ